MRALRSDRFIQAVLTALVVFDAVLVVWAFGFPQWWFQLFHTAAGASPGAVLFLRRCGGNWAAFMLFQAVAWAYWKKYPVWLVVVAGMRLGDIFTDPVYALFAHDPTWMAKVGLPFAGAANVVLGWFLLTCYLQRRSSDEG